MSKLLVLTRSNYDAYEFIKSHNLNISDIIIVKSLSDLISMSAKLYVILPPGPRGFHQFIRPYLILNKYKNVTKFYNKKLINF